MPEYPIDDARRPGTLPLGRVKMNEDVADRVARAHELATLHPVVRLGRPPELVAFDLVFAPARDSRQKKAALPANGYRGQLLTTVADHERYEADSAYAAWVDSLAARLARADALEEACERLRSAVEDEGVNPRFHRLVAREVFGRWPTLAKAVDNAIAALRR